MIRVSISPTRSATYAVCAATCAYCIRIDRAGISAVHAVPCANDRRFRQGVLPGLCADLDLRAVLLACKKFCQKLPSFQNIHHPACTAKLVFRVEQQVHLTAYGNFRLHRFKRHFQKRRQRRRHQNCHIPQRNRKVLHKRPVDLRHVAPCHALVEHAEENAHNLV